MTKVARTLNPAAHVVKRDAFIECALRLMQAKGYQQMSIQDVLDELGASRGAFYHYFDSKQELLGAMVDRIADQALAAVAPVVDDAALTATAKLEHFFEGIAQYKTDRKVLMLEFIKIWKSDDNLIVREKVRDTVVARIAPILARIIRQGITRSRTTRLNGRFSALPELSSGSSALPRDRFRSLTKRLLTSGLGKEAKWPQSSRSTS